MNITVRPARASDVEIIARFNIALASQTEQKTLDPQVVRTGVAALLADPLKGRYFLAEANEQVVGQSAITFEWSDWRNSWLWWLQSVYVDHSWRGQGVFRVLFRQIENAARSENVIGLRLYVERENQPAHATYQSLGMKMAPYNCYEMLF